MVLFLILFMWPIIIPTINLIENVRTNGNKSKIKQNIACMVCIIVTTVSWILNLGWNRIMLFMFGMPATYALVFILVNDFAASYSSKAPRLKVYTVLSYITYLFSFLLFPDCGDYPPAYVFFGLIGDVNAVRLAGRLCIEFFIINIIISSVQLIACLRIRRKIKVAPKEQKSDNENNFTVVK